MRTLKGWVTICTLIFAACFVAAQTNADSNLVYQADSNGKSTYGTINSLIEAIQNGKQIRVGFAMGPVEHWADAGFLTIYGGQVFAQIEGIFQQAPNRLIDNNSIPKMEFASKKDDSWSAIIGTTGVMQMHWEVNREKLLEHFKSEEKVKEYLKSLEKRNLDTKWAAF